MGPVKSLTAYADTLVHTMETEDVSVAILRFANGALGTISATTGAYPGVTTRIEVMGNKGSAVIESDHLTFLHIASEKSAEVGAYGGNPEQYRLKKEARKATASDPAALASVTHALQIADMIRAIREDGTPLVDGNAARHPVEIILAIYESARTQKEVYLS